ncbi:MAG TPA: PadR family transcriptional regulator [Jiangellaceae bacterium]|nr:PadR family transcriptional regulator [Jiangellaceae bacterium]
MSLRHALLGMLADHPASGYDLSRLFETSLKRHAWHARHSQIYPELNRLASEGLVTVVGQGARGRRTYELTEAGRAEFHHWMLNFPESGVVRNEYSLRLFFLGTLDPGDARALLERYAQQGEEESRQLRDRRSEMDRQSLLGFGGLATEFGLRYFEMQRDWAHWAMQQLDQELAAPGLDHSHQSASSTNRTKLG